MKAMKLKYILGAVLSAFIFAGCSDDDEVVGTFGDINVSQSYLSIPETGGSTKVTVRSAADWKFGEVFQTITKNSDGSRDTTYNALPAWLSADVLSGGAGETVVTFSADATNGGREAELQIVSGEHTQFIKVRQGEMTPVKATMPRFWLRLQVRAIVCRVLLLATMATTSSMVTTISRMPQARSSFMVLPIRMVS